MRRLTAFWEFDIVDVEPGKSSWGNRGVEWGGRRCWEKSWVQIASCRPEFLPLGSFRSELQMVAHLSPLLWF